MKKCIFIIVFIWHILTYAQIINTTEIDSLLKINSKKAFNGVGLIYEEGRSKSVFLKGFYCSDNSKKLNTNSKFIIGSISKQITAVLILQLVDKKLLKLTDTVAKYIPKTKYSFVDSIQIFQLLNHTSGAVDNATFLAFQPGEGMIYSNKGYLILQEIIEKITNKKFGKNCEKLFKKANMKNSNAYGKFNHICHYIQKEDKAIIKVQTAANNYIASGGIISTPFDLLQWNLQLHHGKLISDSLYKKMISISSFRNHPIMGKVGYGYGIQIRDTAGLKEIGHGGYALGNISVNFYYPEKKLHVIVLENLDIETDDFGLKFAHEFEIINFIRFTLISNAK